MNIQVVLGDQFGFRREGIWGAIGVLRISEQTLDTDEEMSACFTDWQKAFDCVNWTKLMLILNAEEDWSANCREH